MQMAICGLTPGLNSNRLSLSSPYPRIYFHESLEIQLILCFTSHNALIGLNFEIDFLFRLAPNPKVEILNLPFPRSIFP